MTDTKRRPLSYSAYKKYVTCPMQHKYHYKDGYREKYKSANLLIGTAFDDAFNCMLDELIDPIEAFESAMSDLKNIRWDDIDYDGELLPPEVRKNLLKQVRKLGYKGDDIDELAAILLALPVSEHSDKQKQALTLLCKASWSVKAKLIIAEYDRVVMPLLQEVECVQKEITLDNGRILGIADYVATVEGYGRVLLDNKTSRRPYADDSAKTDSQLALYAAALGCDKVGFTVALKTIKKNKIRTCVDCGNTEAGPLHKSCPGKTNGVRCKGKLNTKINPEATIQVIIDDVSHRAKVLVISSMKAVGHAIDNEIYYRNLTSCNWQYGKPCPFRDLCHNDDETNLKKEK